MKDNSDLDVAPKTWMASFNNLPLFFKIKSKDLSNSIVNVAVDCSLNLTYLMTLVCKQPNFNLNQLEIDEDFHDWFTATRRCVLEFKQTMKKQYESLANKYCQEHKESAADLFSMKRDKTIEAQFGITDKKDTRQKLEDILLSLMPSASRQEQIPDDKALDFKVFRCEQDGPVVTGRGRGYVRVLVPGEDAGAEISPVVVFAGFEEVPGAGDARA